MKKFPKTLASEEFHEQLRESRVDVATDRVRRPTTPDAENRWRKIRDLNFDVEVGPHAALRMLCEWLIDQGKIELGTPQSRMLIRATKDLGAWR